MSVCQRQHSPKDLGKGHYIFLLVAFAKGAGKFSLATLLLDINKVLMGENCKFFKKNIQYICGYLLHVFKMRDICVWITFTFLWNAEYLCLCLEKRKESYLYNLKNIYELFSVHLFILTLFWPHTQWVDWNRNMRFETQLMSSLK